jgi:hypothetical protein
VSLSATTRQQRAERQAAILGYWREKRPGCQSDQHAAWIVGARFGVTQAHVLYVVKLARQRGENV